MGTTTPDHGGGWLSTTNLDFFSSLFFIYENTLKSIYMKETKIK